MKKIILVALFALGTAYASQAQTPASNNPNQADIEFEKEVHDFGSIPQNVPATYTFTFKNTGKEPLIITNASASCGCTTPDWTKEPIKKGEKGYVKATYNAASPGAFNKTVTVVTNGKKGSVTLVLKGDVKPSTPSPAPSK
jgi:hypothetical protein